MYLLDKLSSRGRCDAAMVDEHALARYSDGIDYSALKIAYLERGHEDETIWLARREGSNNEISSY